ncbi:MAG: MBL fold metallo-hydrolase [bacterium]|nr:MBL fold metallo-hydrolase [bacterium]
MKKFLYFLIALVVLVGAAAAVLFNVPAAQDALAKRVATTFLGRTPERLDGLRVIVCGSASPLGRGLERAQACIAVVTNEHFFLFDVGARSPLRMAQARLPMARINGVFLTHFHSDHIAALPDVNLASWVQGRPAPLDVYGPTGVQSVVDGFNAAYGLDRGYRTAHHGAARLPPEIGPMRAQPINPGEVVWQDDLLTVTSFAVEHPPIEPAVGYRVDYRGRSVVISGDTNAADGLFAAAKGADLLLHDALSRTVLDPMIKAATDLGRPAAEIMIDVIDYHADVTSLPARAAGAGIKRLALYHLVPAPPNALVERMFLRGLPDDVILTRDLHTFDLPADSDEIRITEP